MSVDLEVVHHTRYDYAGVVSLAHHLAHLKPIEDSHQRVLAHGLEIGPEPDRCHDSLDAFGNAQCHFSLARPHHSLSVRASHRVRLQARFAGLQPAASPPWESLAARLRYVARAPYDPAVEFTLPSPFVPRLRELRAFALPSFLPGRPVAEAAMDLMQRLHADFRYESRSTEVDTPLLRVLELRRGVCQDFAHLMAGALRMQGLPARYVSGYLLTQAPEGGGDLLGADASHAWVQVWCPGTPGVPDEGPGAGWLDLDPTNCLVPGTGHVRLAIGRDFGDVTPLRGVIRGSGEHTLSVGVRTRLLPTPPSAGP